MLGVKRIFNNWLFILQNDMVFMKQYRFQEKTAIATSLVK
jgi:hypothetical protein